MAIRGLKAGIVINIALLLLLSAILTGIVIILIVQGIMVRGYLQQQEQMLTTMGARILMQQADPPGSRRPAWPEMPNLSSAIWLDQDSRIVYANGPADGPHTAAIEALTRQALHMNSSQRRHLDRQWGIIWWQTNTAIVAVPLRENERVVGAGGAVLSLAPATAGLRRSTLPILLYILFNTAVLTVIGLNRLFRVYLGPVERIVRQADSYADEEDFLFSFRREDNELNRLSRALNRMLGRITTDRKKLQDSIASLAQVNDELRQARSEIIQAEKMAAVGRLAAGVAHEIGNPIGIVLGYLDLLKQDGLAAENREEYLNRSETEIQRINTVIRQLLNLSRPQPAQPEELAVHRIIEDFSTAVRTQPLLRDIQLDTRLQAATDRVFGDGDQLRQVLLNLIINAADAIHDASGKTGGRITIRTCNQATQHPIPTTWLIIDIQDNGPGIKPEHLPNVFDAFFTTKEPGKGTGLGLAVSYTIIEKMGGSISAHNTPEPGAAFSLRLPLMQSV